MPGEKGLSTTAPQNRWAGKKKNKQQHFWKSGELYSSIHIQTIKSENFSHCQKSAAASNTAPYPQADRRQRVKRREAYPNQI